MKRRTERKDNRKPHSKDSNKDMSKLIKETLEQSTEYAIVEKEEISCYTVYTKQKMEADPYYKYIKTFFQKNQINVFVIEKQESGPTNIIAKFGNRNLGEDAVAAALRKLISLLEKEQSVNLIIQIDETHSSLTEAIYKQVYSALQNVIPTLSFSEFSIGMLRWESTLISSDFADRESLGNKTILDLYKYKDEIGHLLSEMPYMDIKGIIAIIFDYAIPTLDDMVMATGDVAIDDINASDL
ncbi:MAG: hypothetical protein AB8B66_06285 [Rickettsiaceae bacterium]